MGSIKGLGSYAAPLVRSTRGKGITKIEDLAKALAPFGNASGQARALAASGALDPFNRNRQAAAEHLIACLKFETGQAGQDLLFALDSPACPNVPSLPRSEEHTSELQSLMRISYAVFCLKKKKKYQEKHLKPLITYQQKNNNKYI